MAYIGSQADDSFNRQKDFLFDRNYLTNPVAAIQRLWEQGEIQNWNRPQDKESWKLVLGYNSILELTSNPDIFGKPQERFLSDDQLQLLALESPQLTPIIPFRRLIAHFLPLVEGNYHTLLRKISIQSITPTVIKPLEPFIDIVLDSLIDEALQTNEFDGVELGTTISFGIIAKLLGIPLEDFDYLKNISHHVLTPSELEPQSQIGMIKTGEAATLIVEYMTELINYKRTNPAKILSAN